MSPEQWAETLKQFDYVYVLNADEFLQETYGGITDAVFESKTVYRVLNDGGNVRLVSSDAEMDN